MIFKIFVFTCVFLVCQGTLQDGLYTRRISPRFWINGQGLNRPEWNYQLVNGKPVVSGFPNANSYVAFELNPQTGQIEQSQIVTQTRPGGPIISMIQNMMHVAGQFVGQLTGALGNAVGGALQTAGQFGQDIRDITNPIIAVPRPPADKEPIKQPGRPEVPRPPALPSVQTQAPSVSVPPTPSTETVPAQGKSDVQTAVGVIDQAIIAFQTLRSNVASNFQTYFEGEEGEKTLSTINENIEVAMKKLQDLREAAASEPNAALQSGQNAVNAAMDSVEDVLERVAGSQGKEFIQPSRNEVNVTFDTALKVYNQSKPSVNSVSEIPSLE